VVTARLPQRMAAFLCHVCGSDELTRIPEYSLLTRVTSDCKPWPAGGKLLVCGNCGCAQAESNEIWQSESNRIYEQYTIYHQGKGAEQSVFDKTGQATSRSDRLLEQLRSKTALPPTGRLLDIGCGNGAFLRAFSRQCPKWSLAGLEVSDQNRALVESIPGVQAFYTGLLGSVEGNFNLISLLHVLEHLPLPKQTLEEVREKLLPDALVLVQVPDCEKNPFMLLVADHATHFFPKHLELLVRNAGFEIAVPTAEWVPKEISVVGRRPGQDSNPPIASEQLSGHGAATEIRRRLQWLESVANQAKALSRLGSFGVFGTSIAGTWVFSEVQGKVDFFVDEDPNRIGQQHFGIPICSPQEVSDGSNILLALPPFLAKRVASRMPAGHARWHVPDDLTVE
jgi:SAM-dependent methyltransferase